MPEEIRGGFMESDRFMEGDRQKRKEFITQLDVLTTLPWKFF